MFSDATSIRETRHTQISNSFELCIMHTKKHVKKKNTVPMYIPAQAMLDHPASIYNLSR